MSNDSPRKYERDRIIVENNTNNNRLDRILDSNNRLREGLRNIFKE